MVFEASKENEKIIININNKNNYTTGWFIYLNNNSLDKVEYHSIFFTEENDWLCMKRILIEAKRFLKERQTSDKGLIDVCWNNFFQSKQPVLFNY